MDKVRSNGEVLIPDVDIFFAKNGDPSLLEDRQLILNKVLSIIFKNSRNKERNINIIKDFFYAEKSELELAEKYGITKRRVQEIINLVKEVRTSGYANVLASEERKIILKLLREYFM